MIANPVHYTMPTGPGYARVPSFLERPSTEAAGVAERAIVHNVGV